MSRNITLHLKSKYPHYILPIISIFLFLPIFMGKTLFLRDFFNFHYPLWCFVEDSLKKGIFPFWNPYLAGGQIAAGNSNYMIFYPPSILIKLLPFPCIFNMNLFLLLHHMAGSILFYKLLRKLNFSNFLSFMGGEIYSLSGVVLSSFIILNYVPYILFFPLISILFLNIISEKNFKNISLFSLSLGIILTLFEPIFFFSLFITLITLYIFSEKKIPIKKLVAPLILSTILSITIASPFLYEGYRVYKNSYREREKNLIENKLYDTHPLFLENLLIPNLFNIDFKKFEISSYTGGKTLNGRFPFFLSIFLGVIPLYFSIYSLFFKKKKAFILFLSTTILLIFSMGHYFKPIPKLFILIPLLNRGRYFSKFLMATSFLIIILSILGLKEFLERRGKNWIYPIIPILLLLSIHPIYLKGRYFTPLILFLFITTILLFRKNEKIFPGIIFFLVSISLFFGNKFILNFTPSKNLLAKSPILTHLKKNDKDKKNYYIAFNPYIYSLSSRNGKYLLDDYIISEKCGVAFYGIVDGFYYLYNTTLDRLESPFSVNMYKFLKKINPIERRIIFGKSGVKYFITPANLNIKGYNLIKSFEIGASHKVNLYKIENASNRFKISHNYTFERVNEFNLYTLIDKRDVINCKNRFKNYHPLSIKDREYLKILSETPNSVVLEVNLLRDGFLIFNTTRSPTWKIKVNGFKVEKCSVNYGFSGIFLKRGRYLVNFYYDHSRTDILSLISLVVILYILYNLLISYPSPLKKKEISPRE